MPLGNLSPRSQLGGDQIRLQRGITLATACLVAFAIIFPRSATTIFQIPGAIALCLWATRPHLRPHGLVLNGLLLALAGFGGWSILSAAWSLAPMASLTKPLFLIAGAVGVTVLYEVTKRSELEILDAITLGIFYGFLGGAALVCFETLSDQAITRWFMNTFAKLRQGYDKHLFLKDGVIIGVGEGNINRRATMVTMLIIPVALLLTGVTMSRFKQILLASWTAITAVILLKSTHQSSQAAILAGGIAFGLAQLSAVWTRRTVATAWCASCLLVVPLVLFLHNANLHKSERVFNSARHRVVIWNTTAEEIKKAPLVGIGADASATKTEIQSRAEIASGSAVRDGGYEVNTARHAHNVFLQVWYELGAIGAVLFMLTGLAALGLCAKAPAQAQPYLLAQFAAMAGMIAFSFSIWQLWLQGAFGLGLIVLLLAIAQPKALKA